MIRQLFVFAYETYVENSCLIRSFHIFNINILAMHMIRFNTRLPRGKGWLPLRTFFWPSKTLFNAAKWLQLIGGHHLRLFQRKKQNKTKQNKTNPPKNKTKQNKKTKTKTKTKQKQKQNKTKTKNKTKQNKTKQKTKQNKTKQNKTKQNKTKQNKTKQNKTKQNKTKQKQNKTKTKLTTRPWERGKISCQSLGRGEWSGYHLTIFVFTPSTILVQKYWCYVHLKLPVLV